MSLIDQIKADIQQITGNSNEFGKEILFKAPGGSTATIVGLHTKHHLSIDTQGLPVNARNAHISVSEQLLKDAGYTTRNASGEVDLTGHRAVVKDSTGQNKEYVIREWFPDETIGLITCILGDFE